MVVLLEDAVLAFLAAFWDTLLINTWKNEEERCNPESVVGQ
jgi:hypothetical protein